LKTFLTLLKVDLLRLFGLNKAMKSGKGGRRVALIVLLAAFIGIIVMIESALFTSMIAFGLPSGERYKAMSFSLLIYLISMIFLTIGTSRVLFGCSDFDMLMSMPVKPAVIVLSKIAYAYLIDFLFALAFIMPAAVICGIAEKAAIVYIPCSLVYCLFLPVVPLVIGLGLGTLVSFVMARIKNKTVVWIIGSILFIGLYVFFLFGTQNSDDAAIVNFFSAKAFAPLWKVVIGMSGRIFNLLLFVVVVSALGALCVWLISANYLRINQAISAKVGGGKFVMTGQSRTAVKKTLFIRELKLFFSSSTTILNTLIGGVISIAMPVMFLINGGLNSLVGDAEGATAAQIAEIVASTREIVIPLLPFVTILFLSISTYSSYAISLEGKRLWVIKSLPVSAKAILQAKMKLSLAIAFPFGIISSIIFGIAVEASVIDVIISILIGCVYLFADSALGLIVNLKFNFFDWRNEAEVVKRGTSVTICMLAGMGGSMVLLALTFLASALVGKYFAWALIFVLLVGFCVLFYKLLMKNCEAKFKGLGEN